MERPDGLSVEIDSVNDALQPNDFEWSFIILSLGLIKSTPKLF